MLAFSVAVGTIVTMIGRRFSQSTKRVVFVVTGGSQGIGFATCKGLVERDKDVVFIGRNESKGKEAEIKLREHGSGNARFVKANVAAEDCAEKILNSLSGRKIQGLLNNAALNTKDPNRVEELLGVNVDACEALSRKLAAKMVDRTSVIVNVVNDSCVWQCASGPARAIIARDQISVSDFWEARKHCSESLNGTDRRGWPQKAYTSSKMLLAMLTRMQAKDPTYATRGISVVAADPGWCRTPMTRGKPAPLSAEQGADTLVWLLCDAKSPACGIYYKRARYGFSERYRGR